MNGNSSKFKLVTPATTMEVNEALSEQDSTSWRFQVVEQQFFKCLGDEDRMSVATSTSEATLRLCDKSISTQLKLGRVPVRRVGKMTANMSNCYACLHMTL